MTKMASCALVQQRRLFPDMVLRPPCLGGVVEHKQQVGFVALGEENKIAHQPYFLAEHVLTKWDSDCRGLPRGRHLLRDPEHAGSQARFGLREILFQEFQHGGVEGPGGVLVGQNALAGSLVDDDSARGICDDSSAEIERFSQLLLLPL